MIQEKSLLRRYILSHPNWVEELQNAPYYLTIRDENGEKLTSSHMPGGMYIFKYNQIESDFSNPIVQEARGIILDSDFGFNVVCKPFSKFFNYGEPNAAEIDWESATVQEKVDGSIVKLFYNFRDHCWDWATNGVIYASRVDLPFPTDNVRTFQDLIDAAIGEDGFDTEVLNTNMTYVFELVGPQNRVVVPYRSPGLYYLASIRNDTFEETFGEAYVFEDFAYAPQFYNLHSVEDCLRFVNSETFNTFKNEGFVVVDKYFNRVKIKTEEYLRVHRLRGDNIPTDKNILDIVRQGETTEFLTYFPEYRVRFEEISAKYENYMENLRQDAKGLEESLALNPEWTRKDVATYARARTNLHYLFAYYDGKVVDPKDFLVSMKIENLLQLIIQ